MHVEGHLIVFSTLRFPPRFEALGEQFPARIRILVELYDSLKHTRPASVHTYTGNNECSFAAPASFFWLR